MRWLDGITDAMNVNLGNLQDRGLVCCSSRGGKGLDMTVPQNKPTNQWNQVAFLEDHFHAIFNFGGDEVSCFFSFYSIS